MARRHLLPRGLLALCALPLLHAHEEWHNLHITYSAKAAFTYPFDGRSPKIGTALLNHYDVIAAETTFSFTIDGQRPPVGAFTAFPDGGNLVVDPQNFAFVSLPTAGIYDGRAGPAPAVGETKEVLFQFVFALAPGVPAPRPLATIPGNPDPGNTDPPGTQTARVRFTNLGDNPVLAGPLPISGTVRLAATSSSANAPEVRVEVATPYSNWFAVATAPAGGGGTTAFSQALPARDDWHLRFSADGFETRVLPVGFVNDPRAPIEVTLGTAPIPDLEYRRIAAITTPTGSWRAAVAESEGTFVVFPGQETWPAAATVAEARARRTASRIAKYTFAGARVWEHAPGWETWAGAATPDGRFVAYALQPAAYSFYTPAENKLVLLDGATGAVVWTKSAAPTDPAIGRRLDALELAFSPDARWIAVGSTGSGTVTLVDRATGNFAWTVPGPGTPTFGQVRSLRFSADNRFLYCGSGDSHVRKLRVSDGAVRWKAFAGGWPDVNGLDLTPDGSWLVAGTQSLDTTMIRTSDGFMQWQREAQAVGATFAPDGRHAVTRGGQIYRTLDGSLAGMSKATGLTRFAGDSRTLVQVGREPRLIDLGGKVLKTFEPTGLGGAEGACGQWAHLSRDGRTLIVLARDLPNPPQSGIAIYERRSLSAASTAPTIAAAPLAQTVAAGGTATLAVSATGPGPFSYEWHRDGTPLLSAAAQAGAILVLPGLSSGDAGTYSCVITNAAGSTTSAPAALAVIPPDAANPSRLSHLAVRAHVGATPLIVGFSVGGAGTAGTKPLLIRGAGPSLAALGVTGALADPQLGLFSGSTNVLANDNWAGDAQVGALAGRLGAFPFSASTSRDAALAATAVGGSYTAQLSSSDATTGTALAEIYDGTPFFGAGTPRLINVSARTEVTAVDLLIAGFVIAGPTAHTVLIRGIGPTLANFGLRTALADPQLTLFRDGVLVAANDHWHDAANAVGVATAATHVGAFALSPNSRDAALLLSLPPGSYTAQVSGANGATNGEALVEVYEVP